MIAPSTGVAGCDTVSIWDCFVSYVYTYRKLAGLMGVLHLETAYIVLHQYRETAEVGVGADPGNFIVF